jgi:glutamate--cysteine ligase
MDLFADPRDAWAAYALDAELMLLRDPASQDWAAPPGLTLRRWLRRIDGALREPTEEDFACHLSTLFPPVRPRGHLELRMIDAQPGDGWVVPLAVCTALLHDPVAAGTALAATARLTEDVSRSAHSLVPGGASRSGSLGGLMLDGILPDGGDPWLRAAWLGPADPVIARASQECFTAAREALDRMDTPAAITAAVDGFIERYVSRRRCPADDFPAHLTSPAYLAAADDEGGFPQ